MATCNFATQDGFPLFCTRIFDGFSYEDEENGEIHFTEFDEWYFERCKERIEELNRTLKYYEITLESGYYEGVQVYLNEKTNASCDIPLTKYYSAKEWKDYRAEEKRWYGKNYDFDLSYSDRKKAEQREIKRIIEFCRTVLKDNYEFDEYVCTARFSNGESCYDLASNERARLYNAVA